MPGRRLTAQAGGRHRAIGKTEYGSSLQPQHGGGGYVVGDNRARFSPRLGTSPQGSRVTGAHPSVLKLTIESNTLSCRLREGIANQDGELASIGVDLDPTDREPGGGSGLQQIGG